MRASCPTLLPHAQEAVPNLLVKVAIHAGSITLAYLDVPGAARILIEAQYDSCVFKKIMWSNYMS